jgi:uncharacterized membrane protein (DUF485 family)
VEGDSPARIDWEEVARSERYQELVAARRRFVVPALVLFVVVFGTFLVLVGYARHIMGTRVVGGFTVAYAYALGLIVFTWALSWSYVAYADRRLSPLADDVAERR